MAIKNWEKFYKEKKAPTKPSDFAKFINYTFENFKNISLIDVGCGNGRDLKLFKKSNWCSLAIGIDKSIKSNFNKDLFNVDLNKIVNNKKTQPPIIVYSRFFLHSISNKEIEKLLRWTKYYFVAEFRLKGDVPKLYKHDRNLVDLGWFVKKLEENGFVIEKLITGYGMAKYKNEDPYVCRVIAKKYEKK